VGAMLMLRAARLAKANVTNISNLSLRPTYGQAVDVKLMSILKDALLIGITTCYSGEKSPPTFKGSVFTLSKHSLGLDEFASDSCSENLLVLLRNVSERRQQRRPRLTGLGGSPIHLHGYSTLFC